MTTTTPKLDRFVAKYGCSVVPLLLKQLAATRSENAAEMMIEIADELGYALGEYADASFKRFEDIQRGRNAEVARPNFQRA